MPVHKDLKVLKDQKVLKDRKVLLALKAHRDPRDQPV